MYLIIDTMNELNTHVALVTETWLSNSASLERKLEDLKNATGYACLRRDRDAREGGVALVLYKKSELLFTCLLYTSPSPRDRQKSRMPSSA